MVENSTAAGEGLRVGTVWDSGFLVNNVTFRNILMEDTRKGIYIKMSTMGHVVKQLLYQNITLKGPVREVPVMIGPINQFSGSCPWSWPLIPGSTCKVENNAQIEVTIDGLWLSR